jgi:hypothetical protein
MLQLQLLSRAKDEMRFKRRIRGGGVDAVVDSATLGAGQREPGDELPPQVLAAGKVARSAGSRITPASQPDLLRAAPATPGEPAAARDGSGSRAGSAGSSSAAMAARRPKTRHSSSELEASRLAP